MHISNVKHNLCGTRIYDIYRGMKDRCFNKNNPHYASYGGRGIIVCDEWLKSVETFYSWAISNGYKQGLSIDRINNDGIYEPSNCRWATQTQQSRNTRKNKILTYNNTSKCVSEWGETLEMDYNKLWHLLFRKKVSLAEIV